MVKNTFFLSGKPLPVVTWYRNDLMWNNVSVALPSGGNSHVRSELRITNLGRRDVHSELTCRASNNPKTPPLAATLQVDMNCEFHSTNSSLPVTSLITFPMCFFFFCFHWENNSVEKIFSQKTYFSLKKKNQLKEYFRWKQNSLKICLLKKIPLKMYFRLNEKNRWKNILVWKKSVKKIFRLKNYFHR